MQKIGLYDPESEHDACGVGFVCNLGGEASRLIVSQALTLIRNMEHRGGSGADADSGDGAGIMFRLPDSFLRAAVDFSLPPEGSYGLGLAFLSRESNICGRLKKMVEACSASLGWQFLGWRQVPVNPDALGQTAYGSRPSVWQFFVADVSADQETGKAGAGEASQRAADALERRLYILRKSLENEARRLASGDDFYLPSLSCRTVVYKGMMTGCQLPLFYPDLADARFASPFAIVHQRYSTNTFPSWRLAQPLRGLAHNGEINTIRGNRNWLAAREPALASPLFGRDIERLFPVIEPEASDSASLDNAMELLVRGGRTMEHTMAMLIPQAWGDKYPLGPNLRSFFEFHAGLMEPWDGPAAVVFTDGVSVGACLDRNGLRPARYSLTADGLMVFASEAGPLTPDEALVIEKGSLRPGQMLVASIGAGRLIKNAEIKSRLARLRPWRRWVSENKLEIPGFYNSSKDYTSDHKPGNSAAALVSRQALFGYDRDDLEIVLAPMAAAGAEATGSMGADIPLAVLDGRPQSLFAYFRQQFAQITNPPIDSIREELVMSLMTFIGYNPNILAEEPGQARLIKLKHPFLANDDLQRLEELKYADFHSTVLDATFNPPGPEDEPGCCLAQALNNLEDAAFDAVQSGSKILVISDRAAGPERLPIPSLLAVAAVNRKLTQTGARVSVGLVCETGEAREASHMAMLLSLGASAVNPWLAFETVANMAENGLLPTQTGANTAVDNYVQALKKGLLKIMSKMGISTLRGYRGARIFEAVGLGRELMGKYFPDIVSRVGGIGLGRIEKDVVSKWEKAKEYASALFINEPKKPPQKSLPAGGVYKYHRDGVRHLWTPQAINLLQRAVRQGDYEVYKQYASLVNMQAENAFTLRGLMDFVPSQAVNIDEVESESSIVRRFVTGAMSLGSLSSEAHEALAVAMNRLGCQSNSGEGGEDPARYRGTDGASHSSSRSSIKQVASGRFGVTLEYLVNADELQIKIAQGAKPGEGGQLPGHKVNEDIARVRHSTAGVTLISPPPHHDIYSIEDIAQLIYDLCQANEKAAVSVKLASETGVGTIAAGVAKAMASAIIISGFDGGTGASPLSSIHYAGSPWEIGLAEVQQTLVLNNLRSRVKLQVDGQLKTGRDVIIASLLGADQFGFATAALISLGCVMMRKCHTNGCPVGVATQDPKLRARFKGQPEHLISLFTFIAREVREIMASLGFRSMDDMTGQVEYLRQNLVSHQPAVGPGLDFSALLMPPQGTDRRFMGPAYDVRPAEAAFDASLLPAVVQAVEQNEVRQISRTVANTDRSVGTRISSHIVRAKGSAGLPDDSIILNLEGTAGQSFGAFAARGLTLNLMGEANDYVGKGLSGGRIIVRPSSVLHPAFIPSANAIAGNVALYGATSGELYLCGQAGERFAVRNSGALAVVEGIGDHGCEYMTGGRVAVLGLTGVNFAAGMSGGLAYVYDQDGLFDSRCNLEMVDLDLLTVDDETELRSILKKHQAFTGSVLAGTMLDNWANEKGRFVKVFPQEYRRILGL